MSDEPSTTISRIPESTRGVARVQRLCVVHGHEAGQVVLLDPSRPWVLGRAPAGNATLHLSDAECSKQHARVFVDGASGSWMVEDLGSRNGTLVDGRRQARAPLAHGSVLRFGATVVLFDDVEVPSDASVEPETDALQGPSLAMARVRAEVRQVARQAVSVLVSGETGVGKERVALELHRQSGRKGQLVPVNCAAISPSLAESELFGHTAGAFTGATGSSGGLVVAAEGGTLFLDEIGELPLALQPKLLRMLSNREVRPVGGDRVRTVDVRVVTATHRDLPALVEAGSFRGDLYARLSGWVIRVAPLRERKLDVLALARHFLPERTRLSPEAAEALLLHDWPYNVRELEQVLAAAKTRAGDGTVESRVGKPPSIKREHLPAAVSARLGDRATKASSSSQPPLALLVPRDLAPTQQGLEQVLRHFKGNMAEVAEWFGKDRRQVYRWAERFGIDPEAFRS